VLCSAPTSLNVSMNGYMVSMIAGSARFTVSSYQVDAYTGSTQPGTPG